MRAKPSRFSSAFVARGCGAAWMRSAVSTSPNSCALAAIMKCSAVAYVTPFTANAAGHHWLRQLFPVPPAGPCLPPDSRIAWPPRRRLAGMSTTEQGGAGQDPREYVRRMRALPADQVIRDVLFSLLNAAQVKLGRKDARLLIDVTTVAHEHARPYLPGEISRQIDQVVGQLRMGQVSAEGKASQKEEPEENDLGRLPTPPSAGTSA